MRTKLKQFRVGVHLTQSEFAAKIGVSRAAYAYVEQGKRSGKDTLWSAIQREFGVPDADMYKLMKLDETGENDEK